MRTDINNKKTITIASIFCILAVMLAVTACGSGKNKAEVKDVTDTQIATMSNAASETPSVPVTKNEATDAIVKDNESGELVINSESENVSVSENENGEKIATVKTETGEEIQVVVKDDGTGKLTVDNSKTVDKDGKVVSAAESGNKDNGKNTEIEVDDNGNVVIKTTVTPVNTNTPASTKAPSDTGNKQETTSGGSQTGSGTGNTGSSNTGSSNTGTGNGTTTAPKVSVTPAATSTEPTPKPATVAPTQAPVATPTTHVHNWVVSGSYTDHYDATYKWEYYVDSFTNKENIDIWTGYNYEYPMYDNKNELECGFVELYEYTVTETGEITGQTWNETHYGIKPTAWAYSEAEADPENFKYFVKATRSYDDNVRAYMRGKYWHRFDNYSPLVVEFTDYYENSRKVVDQPAYDLVTTIYTCCCGETKSETVKK